MNEAFNFAELCRLCSLKSNHQLQIFDKEGEQRQLFFKIRSCIPTEVRFALVFFFFFFHALMYVYFVFHCLRPIYVSR